MTMTAEQQSLMAILRKHYGDTAVLEAIAETGSIEDARKQLNRDRQRERRQREKAERREVRANQVLFRATVAIGPDLARLLASAKRVRSGSLHQMLRATCQRSVWIGNTEHGSAHNNLIVLWDLRAGDPAFGAVASCEMVWTGADYRLHFWRRRNDSRQVANLDLSPSTPINPPLSAPVPAWADDLSDLK
jgi:hypothetical protein